MSTTAKSIRDAEEAIRRRFLKDGVCQTLKYAADQVIETDQWWYVPSCSIGSAGFIVNKADSYVNWLGSALSLEQCFWGHDHGVFCDLVDFAFQSDTEMTLAARLLPRFKHRRPDLVGRVPGEPVWYRDSEVKHALAGQFPIFRRHFVWFAIPELRHAYQEEGLRFTCGLSDTTQPLGRDDASVRTVV